MANFINGYDNPRFLIRQSSQGSLIETIDLDRLIYDGLLETYEDEDIVHQTAKGIIHKIPRDKRIRFTINYSDYIIKDNLLKIQRILKYEKAGKSVFLIPRKDVLSRIFEVVYAGDNFEMGLWMGGLKSPGNRLPILSWVTKARVDINWLDPDDINVPIEDFITI